MITAFGIVRLHDLFAVVILAGIVSLLAASLYVLLSAVDVAFTEASVGAGISTLLMLATLAITGEFEKKNGAQHFVAKGNSYRYRCGTYLWHTRHAALRRN